MHGEVPLMTSEEYVHMADGWLYDYGTTYLTNGWYSQKGGDQKYVDIKNGDKPVPIGGAMKEAKRMSQLTLNDLIPLQYHYTVGQLIDKALQKCEPTTEEAKAFAEWWGTELDVDDLMKLGLHDD